MSKWTIYIADDQTLFRKGMARLVKSFNFTSEIKEAANGKEMLALVADKQPDAILMDLDMPVMDGIEATEKILNKYPDVKVIILTSHSEHQHVLYLMEVGAHAFLLKNAEPDEVKEAIESVITRDFYQNQLVVEAMRKGVVENRKQKMSRPLFDNQISLTDREKEILTLICRELTMKEISDKLALSEKTIHNHRARIMEKVGAKNTVGMVKYAYETGLLS